MLFGVFLQPGRWFRWRGRQGRAGQRREGHCVAELAQEGRPLTHTGSEGGLQWQQMRQSALRVFGALGRAVPVDACWRPSSLHLERAVCLSAACVLILQGTALSLFIRFWCRAYHWCYGCLQSDATYLIVTDNGEIENFGLNAVCTHLGCVVPWNDVSVKHNFMEHNDHEIQILQHVLITSSSS